MAPKIKDVLRANPRFARSVNLERDFRDPLALDGYHITAHAKAHFARLGAGLAPHSTQRAWRITGDYGCGKSSFALAIAHLLSGRNEHMERLGTLADWRALRLRHRPELLPVLVTGSREPLATALLRGLGKALEAIVTRGLQPPILRRIATTLHRSSRMETTDLEFFAILAGVQDYLRQAKKGSGVLLVIDELGKFLEFAAMNPDRQDVYLLQRLAEAAAGSGEQPFLVVGILHQGFNAYSEQLSPTAQREWEKIAGRFDELLFHQPLEQTVSLISQALGVRQRDLPTSIADRARTEMRNAVEHNWYGPGVSSQGLRSNAAGLFPLHPITVPVLTGLLSRFGQNERSLLGFLFSTEPFGLMSFADRLLAPGDSYRLDTLYDYARTTLGHRLNVQGYRSHWSQIDSLISSFSTSNPLELRVLKAVGVLNLLDADALRATRDSICLALESGTVTVQEVDDTINALKARHVLYDRGAASGFCLWPHTSVNLELAQDRAAVAVGTPQRVAPLLTARLETRPMVARRHYIQTGNLRYFNVTYRSVGDLTDPMPAASDAADGAIVIFLCETVEEHAQALKDACREVFRRPDVVVAVSKPLQGMLPLVLEATRWRWIAQNTPELNSDHYAAAEVSRQIYAAERRRDARVQEHLGLRHFSGPTVLQWYYCGQLTKIAGARELLSRLSEICDVVYAEAPLIKNELVNRRQLSSAAAAARMRLVERAFSSAAEPCLGMDPDKAPPEMSMYLSVLKASGLHRKVGDAYRFSEPPPGDPCRVRPALARMLDVLRSRQDSRVSVSDLLDELRRPPFGVRDGIGLLLLTVVAQLHENDLAFYEDGAFLSQITGAEMHRLVKAPGGFEIQYCRVAGVRGVLFEHLAHSLLPERAAGGQANVLEVVRPLCVFAAGLPAFTQRTQRLSATARAVRSALVAAKEPGPLLFEELPRACGFEPFGTSTRSPERERAAAFVGVLKAAYEELKTAYGNLLAAMRATLALTFERETDTRSALQAAAGPLVANVNDPVLRALCLRFVDDKLGDTAWLESIGSLVREKPPAKWVDADVDHFAEQLGHLARRFRRVESLNFPAVGRRSATALRVVITKPDGSEFDHVFDVSSHDEQAVRELEARLLPLLRAGKGRVGVAAATRAVWKELARHEAEN